MRALILSDVHGNLEALTAVLAAAEPFDAIWNLGDVVGYGGSPNEVVDLIRARAQVNVRGNHDRVCCGLTSATGFNPVARAAAMWTKEELTAGNLEWLKAVAQGPVKPDGQSAATCVHGSPLNEDQYILNMRDAWAPLQQMETAVTFFGHTHVQGGFSQKEHDWREIKPDFRTRTIAESWRMEMPDGMRHLVNPGSVGQPRDCDWRAAFAMYDSDAAAVDYWRVPYDVTSAQGRILMAGLPERLAARLREGR
ncbi:MAG: metallophosphatase family protein [Acidobacteriota bacterium]|nr:metallophosphatase family protein [Acidobacteriota bacterium]